MAEMTPMMQQYLEIKKQYPDTILFFRLGDFYEMFNEDAVKASEELELTLTTRDRKKPKEEQTPMCGVPYHSSDSYIARLIQKGYKVAICEQVEEPADAKGLVKRKILRVVTPGTVTDATALEERRSNFIAGVFVDRDVAGVCFCDITTGKTHATAFSGKDKMVSLLNELGSFRPKEAIINKEALEEDSLIAFLKERLRCLTQSLPAAAFSQNAAEKAVLRQFGEDAYQNLPKNNMAALLSLGGLLTYLYDTQKTDLSYINDLSFYQRGRFMELDLAARRNLELTETLRSKEKRGSLLWVLDKTKTAMGGRLLGTWLMQPLLDVVEIQKRHSAVEHLVNSLIVREELLHAMTGMGDMERLIGRIVYGSAGGKDLVALKNALYRLPSIKEQLSRTEAPLLKTLYQKLHTLEEVAALIDAAIKDDPPFSIREGGFIKDGYSAEVDELRQIQEGGTSFLSAIETRERERTGIRTLKVGFNKVFGYYIEVSKSFSQQVPPEYIRKQTLVNGERFITPELKELEEKVLGAKDRLSSLEGKLFLEITAAITEKTTEIQESAQVVATVDTLCSFAEIAVKYHYCRPEMDNGHVLEIHEGRHPVVERVLKDTMFVPNDTYMGEKEHRCAIITGPNMAGKSTYMRQVALITLLAQIGSFVPAKSARIGIVDRIFTRIGASDDLTAGQSTFMVEMTEVSDILKYATKKSLLILDEIGRGTSTYDGMSIAQAVLEYCAKTLGAKTLFATHYHELTCLENELPNVTNYSIAIKTRGEDIIFLRKIVSGGADRSYGIEVGKLAGLPDHVVKRAKEILQELETEGCRSPLLFERKGEQEQQLSLGAIGEMEVIDRLRRTHVETLTPIEAMTLLYELKKKLEG